MVSTEDDDFITKVQLPWQCSCGAWNPDEQQACRNMKPWPGPRKQKKQMKIPIAEYGDGVPWHHESAVPLKEDNDEKIEKKIKVK